MAGRGRYPLLFCEAARAAGARVAVVAMRDETDPAIEALADTVEWVHVGQVGKAIKSLRKRAVEQVVFAGQIKPGRLFTGFRPDLRAVKLLAGLKERNAESIFTGIANEFEKDGITVMPATLFLEADLAGEGVLGKRKPSKIQHADVEFGLRIAREVSALDIGQTVVVKKGTVLAVEAFEGTDRAIKRGGELGHGDVRVVKVSKPDQDLRFDVPCIGTRTVESLKTAGADLLAVTAGATLLLDRELVLKQLDEAGIVLYGCPRY